MLRVCDSPLRGDRAVRGHAVVFQCFERIETSARRGERAAPINFQICSVRRRPARRGEISAAVDACAAGRPTRAR